jgi:hypothetical protein
VHRESWFREGLEYLSSGHVLWKCIIHIICECGVPFQSKTRNILNIHRGSPSSPHLAQLVVHVKMIRLEGELLGFVAAAVIFLIILFSQFRLVESATCSGRGFINGTDGICSCMTNYYGTNCQYLRCPFGESWLSPPLESHVRNVPLVECSNMGSCNPNTGVCTCREGYVGKACERWACPTGLFTGQNVTGSLIISKQTDTTTYPQICSGHGICKSLSQMGTSFDGM